MAIEMRRTEIVRLLTGRRQRVHVVRQTGVLDTPFRHLFN